VLKNTLSSTTHEIKPSSGSLMDAAMTVFEEAHDRFDRVGNHG